MRDIWIPAILFILIIITAIYVVIFRRNRTTWKSGFVNLLAMAEINFAILMLHISTDLSQKLFWYKMIYAGFTIVPTGFLIMSLYITGQNRFIRPKYLLILCSIPVIGNVILFTNEYHGLDWNPAHIVQIVNSMNFPPISDIGVVFWIWLGYSSVCLSLSVFLFVREITQKKGFYNWEFAGWILAAVFGLLGVLLDIFRLTSFKPFTMTTLGFSVFSIGVVFLLSNLRRRDIIAVSRGTIFSNISDIIIVVDENSVIVDVNQTIRKLLPESNVRLKGVPVNQLFPELAIAISSPNPQQKTLTLERNNQKFIFDLRISPIFDWQGKKRSQVIVLRDITQQKETEEVMRYFTEGTHAIFWRAVVTQEKATENGPDNFHWDTQYANLETVNKFIPFQDYPSHIIRDMFFFSEVEEDRIQMHKKSSESLISGAESYTNEFRILDANGVIHWMSEDARILGSENNRYEVIGLITEITERKRSEEEILRLNTELEQKVLDRTIELETAVNALKKTNKELEAFSYSVSHDLKQPLRAIAGFSNIINSQYSNQLGSEGTRLFELIEKNTLRMDLIIADMLKLSRISRIEIKPLEITMSELVSATIDELNSNEENKKVEFTVTTLPDGYGDLAMIQQVWNNLISNAIKYTSPKKERKVEIGSYPENGTDVYYIKDNGVGFNPNYADKLFTAFQRLHSDNEFEGSGIGLAIVKRIIDRHGGTVWAEGEVDQGSTFYFSLPRK
jgi:PAS domain S-box-containing protein